MPITAEQFSNATVDAELRLTARRTARYDDAFRDGLLEATGEIAIASELFHPADVLHRMAEETCRIAKEESKEDFRERFLDIVIDEYPSPIALAYNSFVHGARTSLARLGFMRDTWEAAVAVCYALVISESAAVGVTLSDAVMRDGPKNNPRSLKARDLRSDSVSARLGVIEGILAWADVVNAPLSACDIIPVEVIGEMRRLNDVRNGFSHQQTKSEAQARRIIEECEEDLLEILIDLGELANLDLFRIHGIAAQDTNTLEVERLGGSVMARRIRKETVAPSVVSVCAAIPLNGDCDPVLFRFRDRAFVASPYFYCGDDTSGHHTRVYIFKRAHDAGTIRFEVSAHSETITFPAPQIQPEIDRVSQLIET